MMAIEQRRWIGPGGDLRPGLVTATAAMRLAGANAVDVNAPVTDYWPAFAVVRQPRPVTVRHLLGHSSGLANPVPIRWVRPQARHAQPKTCRPARVIGLP